MSSVAISRYADRWQPTYGEVKFSEGLTNVFFRYINNPFPGGESPSGTLKVSKGGREKIYEKLYFAEEELEAVMKRDVQEIASRLFCLDETAFQRLLLKEKDPFDLSEFQKDITQAALCSSDPKVKELGKGWHLKEEMRPVAVFHQRMVKTIEHYFARIDFWDASVAKIKGDEEGLKEENIVPFDEKYPQRMKERISRALWFKEHPYHERCIAILKECEQQRKELQGKFFYSSFVDKHKKLGGIIYSIHMDERHPFDHCIRVRALEHWRFPGETLEEALRLEQERYEAEKANLYAVHGNHETENDNNNKR